MRVRDCAGDGLAQGRGEERSSTFREKSLPVPVDGKTVWLSQSQMAQLFGKDRTVIARHIRNAISEGEIDAVTMCAKFAHIGVDQDQVYKTEIYNLDCPRTFEEACDYLRGRQSRPTLWRRTTFHYLQIVEGRGCRVLLHSFGLDTPCSQV